MAVLASLQEVRSALRIDDDDYDPSLALLIEAASGAVINYLKSSADQYLGADGEALRMSSFRRPSRRRRFFWWVT